jgi:hypothetical protein
MGAPCPCERYRNVRELRVVARGFPIGQTCKSLKLTSCSLSELATYTQSLPISAIARWN